MIVVRPDGPVSEAAVAALETRLGTRLPQDYRDWLMAVGGGETDRDQRVENGVVSEFLGLGGGAAYDLGTWRRPTGFSAWVPHAFLVIAPAAGGSLCLKLEDPDAGSIWWADYDRGLEVAGEDDPGEPLPEIMRRLADSVTAFLTSYEPS